MTNCLPALAAVALFGALTMFCNSTSATPLSGALAIKNAVPSSVETVRWGGGGWGGRVGVVAAGAAAVGAAVGVGVVPVGVGAERQLSASRSLVSGSVAGAGFRPRGAGSELGCAAVVGVMVAGE
jgi:hypothetical protein